MNKVFLIGYIAACCSTLASAAEPIQQQIDALKKGDKAARVEAAREIGLLGAKGQDAVSALVEALEAEDSEVAYEAAKALAAIGPAAKKATKSLTEQLASKDPLARAYAAHALGAIGEGAQDAAPDLIKAVLDDDIRVRREVRDALRKIKAPREKTIPLMVRTLEEGDPRVVLPALQTLAELGEDAAPLLKDALKHPRASYWACVVATELGPKAASLLPELEAAAKHDDPETRMQALLALGSIGPGAKDAVPTAIAALKNSKELGGVHYAAAYALGKIKADGESLAALEQALASDDPHLRVVSGWAILNKQHDNRALRKKALDSVLAGLKAEDAKVREAAARSLVELEPTEPPPPEAMEALASALSDASPEVVNQVIEGLAAKGIRAITPRMMQALQHEKLRQYAARVVRRIGPEARVALPFLLTALRTSKDDAVATRELQFALGAIGPAAAPAWPQLVDSLSASDPEVRYSACYALGRIGAAAAPAMPKLKGLLTSDDEFLAMGAAWALANINPKDTQTAAQTVPLLARMLKDDRAHVRAGAASALGMYGPAASSAAPQLKAALEDGSPEVQAAVREALKKVQP